MDGIYVQCMGRKIMNDGNCTDEQLNATLLAIDDGAPIKSASRIHGISTTSLWDHDTGKTIGRKCGKLGVLSFQEESELVNWSLKMHRLSHPINLSQCHLRWLGSPKTMIHHVSLVIYQCLKF